MGLTNTIGDILKSGKPDNCSNIRILPSIKSKLLGAIKDENHATLEYYLTLERPSQMKRTQKLKEKIHRLKHKAFVNCVEWTRTCDVAELSNRGVM